MIRDCVIWARPTIILIFTTLSLSLFIGCSEPADPVVLLNGGDATEQCSPGEDWCGEGCISVVSDPENCGQCGRSCQDGFVCSDEQCAVAPDDCRVEDATCPTLTWCDESDGRCKPGCAGNSDCHSNGHCDVESRQCICDDDFLTCGTHCLDCDPPANANSVCAGAECGFECHSGYRECGDSCSKCPTGGTTETTCEDGQCVATECVDGMHLCDGECVDSTSPQTCGSRCDPCPEPSAGGHAVCVSGECDISCDNDYRDCDGDCASCPSDGVTTTQCWGPACVAATCEADHLACGEGCVSCPVGALETTCGDNNQCIATDCAEGRRLCNGYCLTCPANSVQTTCNGNSCAVTECEPGYTLCDDSCCGVTIYHEENLVYDASVGVAIRDSGDAVTAWRYSTGMHIHAFDGTSLGYTPDVLGSDDSRGISYDVADDGTEHLVWIQIGQDSGWSSEDDTLQHSYRSPGESWSTDEVHTGTTFLATALALTDDGSPRIVVSDNLPDELYYLEKNSDGWSSATLIPDVYDARRFNLAIDENDVAHIVVDDSSDTLPYITGTAGSLSTGPDIDWGNGERPDIAIDGTDVYVVYNESVDEEIFLATLDGGNWSSEFLHASDRDDIPMALEFDADGMLHIAGGDCQGTCGVLYGVYDDGDWYPQVLYDINGNHIVPTHIDISVTDDGTPAILTSTLNDGAYFFSK